MRATSDRRGLRWSSAAACAVLIALSALPARAETMAPVADAKAVVVSGQARFTVLTPRLIRMEWSATSEFEDRASLVFIDRRQPVPPFTSAVKGGWLTVATDKVTLRYKTGSGAFTAANLEVRFTLNGAPVAWHPGLEDTGNLLGTTRTLDGVNGPATRLEPGLISRDGWVVVDDTARLLYDGSDWPWVTPRPAGKRQDLYFFGHGHDYRGALADFTKVAGPIPMPPRFAFGIWWSRYWAYTDVEFEQLVRDFEARTLPLDVLVVDMDWHFDVRRSRWDDNPKDASGHTKGWTGFTWDPNYFPDPAGFLDWTDVHGLRTPLNLHPASGIQPWESQYPAMAKAMGIDPASQKYVPFDIVDKKFASNFFDLVIHPLERQGVDFWWLDWQQSDKTSLEGHQPDLVAELRVLHRHGAAGEAPAADLPPVGRSRQSPVPDRVLGRHLLDVAVAGLPAVLHGDGRQRRLRLLEPRHRRPHERAGRSGAVHAVDPVRRVQPDPPHAHHEEPRRGAADLGVPARVLRRDARGVPAALVADSVHLHRVARDLRHRRAVPATALLGLTGSDRSVREQGRVPLRRQPAGGADRRAEGHADRPGHPVGVAAGGLMGRVVVGPRVRRAGDDSRGTSRSTRFPSTSRAVRSSRCSTRSSARARTRWPIRSCWRSFPQGTVDTSRSTTSGATRRRRGLRHAGIDDDARATRIRANRRRTRRARARGRPCARRRTGDRGPSDRADAGAVSRHAGDARLRDPAAQPPPPHVATVNGRAGGVRDRPRSATERYEGRTAAGARRSGGTRATRPPSSSRPAGLRASVATEVRVEVDPGPAAGAGLAREPTLAEQIAAGFAGTMRRLHDLLDPRERRVAGRGASGDPVEPRAGGEPDVDRPGLGAAPSSSRFETKLADLQGGRSTSWRSRLGRARGRTRCFKEMGY